MQEKVSGLAHRVPSAPKAPFRDIGGQGGRFRFLGFRPSFQDELPSIAALRNAAWNAFDHDNRKPNHRRQSVRKRPDYRLFPKSLAFATGRFCYPCVRVGHTEYLEARVGFEPQPQTDNT
jgi:hypothetical protein